MTRIEVLERIIKQKGSCNGISCVDDKCPLSRAFGNDLCNTRKENLKTAKEMLVLEEKKEFEEMANKLEGCVDNLWVLDYQGGTCAGEVSDEIDIIKTIIEQLRVRGGIK